MNIKEYVTDLSVKSMLWLSIALMLYSEHRELDVNIEEVHDNLISKTLLVQILMAI